MPSVTLSDYFCGDEEIQFSHFRIPRQLITHPHFKPLSTDAKLLYGMLLNRMSLSAKNGWHDNTGRVYIYFTVKEVCEAIGCGRNKAMRLLAELDTSKGIGLIERVKQGQGKPDSGSLYRKIRRHPAKALPHPFHRLIFPTSRGRKNRLQGVGKIDLLRFQMQTQVILIKTKLILSILINLSIPLPPSRNDWRWMDTS